ncbi:MAG: ABC transporter substrate-binding protein [Pyramidobacter sp.]|jgi:iron complex transport system substrate-binding protein
MASAILRKISAAFLAAALIAFPACAYERIISLYGGHTDNIIALGGASRITGTTANYERHRLPEIPRFPIKTNAEALLALKPDLVLMRTLVEKRNPELKSVLERAGVKTLLIDPPSWDGFKDYLKELAPLVGVSPEEAIKLFDGVCEEIRSEAEKRRGGDSRPRVFVEATSKELHTCAPDSWAARLIDLAGGQNAAAEAMPIRRGSSIAPWGLERVMKLLSSGLDVYLVENGPMNSSTEDDVKSRSWAQALGAAKVGIVPEYQLARPSLLGLREGGMKLIELFYGE